MRPVNLLPGGVAARAGSGLPGAGQSKLGFVVIGVLAAVLLGVVAMVHFSNQVGEKQDEIARLQATEAEARARAASLSQFTSFEDVREARLQTITALAESRFDWERVMRELAIVLPKRVWLTNLTGTVDPTVTVENAAASTQRASVPGPALQLVGCARSHRDVARLIASLEDLDGVTRVTVEDSGKPDSEVAGGEAGAASSEVNTSEDCRTRDFVTQFHAVAAFDAVAVPEGAVPASPVAPPVATTEAPAEPAPTTTTASTDAGQPASEQAGVAEAEDESGEALESLGGKDKQR